VKEWEASMPPLVLRQPSSRLYSLAFAYCTRVGKVSDLTTKVIEEDDLTPVLARTFADIYRHSPLPAGLCFDELLARYSSLMALDRALEQVFYTAGVRTIEVEAGAKLYRRSADLLEVPDCKLLPLSVSVRIDRVDLPDTARDEVVLHALITTGCPLQDFADFVVLHKLMTEEEMLAAISRWKHSGYAIGLLPDERQLLDRVLGVHLESTTEREVLGFEANIGMITQYLWCMTSESITISTTLDLSAFPFDVSRVTIRVVPKFVVFGATTLVVDKALGGAYELSARRLQIIPPRGFDIPDEYLHPQEFIRSPGVDFLLGPVIQYSFTLRRLPHTVLWRVVLPSVFVTALAFISVSVVMLGRGDIQAVLTSVLPSVLIASVALQLTANQFSPAQAGRTLLDLMFIVVYGTLLALFLAVQFAATPFGRSLWIVCGLLLASIAVFFFDAWATWYTAKERIYYARQGVTVTDRRLIVSAKQWPIARIFSFSLQADGSQWRLLLYGANKQELHTVKVETYNEAELIAHALKTVMPKRTASA
jgi:hypothetical protein